MILISATYSIILKIDEFEQHIHKQMGMEELNNNLLQSKK